MCGKVKSDVKQEERNGLKALFKRREQLHSIPFAAILSLSPPNSSLIGWSRMPASNFCPQTDNEAATLLFIMDYCTAHDVPPLHRQLTKDLIEYLSGVHLQPHVWTQAIKNTQRHAFTCTCRCTHRCTQTFTRRNLPFGIYPTSTSFNVLPKVWNYWY